MLLLLLFSVALISLNIVSFGVSDQALCGPRNGNKPCPSQFPCCSKWGFCGATDYYCDTQRFGCLYGCWKNTTIESGGANEDVQERTSILGTKNIVGVQSSKRIAKTSPTLKKNLGRTHVIRKKDVERAVEEFLRGLPAVELDEDTVSVQSGFGNKLVSDMSKNVYSDLSDPSSGPIVEEDSRVTEELTRSKQTGSNRLSSLSADSLQRFIDYNALGSSSATSNASPNMHETVASVEDESSSPGIRFPILSPSSAGPFNSPLSEPFMAAENPYFDARGLYSSCALKGTVALTYDDGPSVHTNELLDLLKEFDFPATFFLLGTHLTEEFKPVVRRMYAEGHTLASHTYSHQNLTTLDIHTLKREMNLTSDKIFALTGKRPMYMRPPHGEFNPKLKKTLFSMGYKIILWNLDTNDWQHTKDSKKITTTFKKYLQRFEKVNDFKSWIPLQHDIFPSTIREQREIFEFLKAHNYKVVSMPECLQDSQGPYMATAAS